MIDRRTGARLALVLLGVAAFLLKPAYHGAFDHAVHAWGGNVVVSFAVTLLAFIAASRHGGGRLAAAAAALAAVEAFEVSNGFGVMANVYDPLDLVANAVGVGLALGVDTLLEPRG